MLDSPPPATVRPRRFLPAFHAPEPPASSPAAQYYYPRGGGFPQPPSLASSYPRPDPALTNTPPPPATVRPRRFLPAFHAPEPPASSPAAQYYYPRGGGFPQPPSLASSYPRPDPALTNTPPKLGFLFFYSPFPSLPPSRVQSRLLLARVNPHLSLLSPPLPAGSRRPPGKAEQSRSWWGRP